MILVAIGIVVGFLVALGLTRVMATLLYDVSANDVSIYAIVIALLGVFSLEDEALDLIRRVKGVAFTRVEIVSILLQDTADVSAVGRSALVSDFAEDQHLAGAEEVRRRPIKGAPIDSQAKITLAQARSTALVARPGKITDQELENERGGTGLRYSFDIKGNGKTFEVGVDARTGKVLENKAEGPNPD